MAQPRRAFEKKNKQPINQFIKAEKVRLISQTGEQLGVVELKEALAKAKDQELDLVQMNKDSDTPVCKMMDYGKGNISCGSNLETEEETHVAMTGLWFRLHDKIQRLKQLVLLKKDAKVKNESIKDTFQDLSIYGIIAQIVGNGNWK